MKKKLSSKKCIALILAVVMIITSIPLMMVGAEIIPGSYDPAPSFSEVAIKQGADAWLDEDGNIQVKFPAATLGASYAEYKNEIKDGVVTDAEKADRKDIPIAFYILELVDMGSKNAVHQKNVLDTIKVTGTSATFKAADIGTVDFEKNRYSVTITAVDKENWFSLPIYTTVTDVPVAKIDPNQFANFSTSATAVREMATFDGETDSDNTATTTGNALLYMGPAAEAGTEDLTDNVGDTSALRFIMNDMPSGTQTFYTSYSRETWDFKGAEEVWYWLDFSNVNIQGLAFNLGAQCKDVTGWADGKSINVSENEVIQYSTKATTKSGYSGEAPYVYIQREDAGWDKVMMTNGTIDLSNFKGYVRIPIKFFCSEKDTYITTTNTEFGTDKSSIVATSPWVWTDTNELVAQTRANGDAYVVTLKSSTQIPVDVAGTPITEALMIQHRYFKCSGCKKALTAYGEDQVWDLGYMPAAAVGADSDDGLYTQTSGEAASKRATVNLSAGTITRNADTYRAIEDLKTMGFSYENCSTDSLENSFFIDNIFFYRSDGGAYPNNSLVEGETKIGSPMTTYYNQDLEIARIIFDEIDKRILDPDWADYRELEYILELIEEYKNLYISQGKDASFLNLSRSPDTTGMAGMATKLNRTATWEKAWLAYAACSAEGTIDTTQSAIQDWFISNGRKDDLVPNIVNTMEKLPKPGSITSVSETLRKEIIKLWKAYSLLNLGQLDMLGKAEEEKILKYVALLEGGEKTEDEFIVGQQLADFPYIVYNDFENQEVGTKGWKLEDNKDAYTTGVAGGTGNFANDWRHTKGLVTYTYNGTWDAPGALEGVQNIVDKDLLGYVTTDADKAHESLDDKVHYNASWATITDRGYMNSNAATMNVDSSFTADNHKGVHHTVTIARHGKDSANWTEFQANNAGLDNLGALSTQNVIGTTSIGLSLIFYADFTEIENFYFTANIFGKKDGVDHKFRVDMGAAINDDAKINNWKYFILNPETGEWVINHTTSQYCFTSRKTNESWGDTLSLDGYKGYIMIPLYHIKSGDAGEGVTGKDKLDGNSDWLNSIYAIQFCIGGAEGTSLDEKSFTIDNVGFTYDPAGYTGVSHPSYAEVFNAKSLPAKQFEEAVAAIDPYDEVALSEKVQAAQAIYSTLPPYQEQFVEESYKKLELYTTYINNPSNIPQPDTTANNLVTWITNNLNSDATGAKVTDVEKDAEGNIIKDYDLPYPGFVIVTNENGKREAVPNYAAYGLTAELAAQLEEFYNNSYIYYSVAEKQQVKDAGFLNAYNAAMRCLKSLESIKTDALTFLPEITGLYTVKYDYNGDGILDDKDESVTDSDNYKIGNFLSTDNNSRDKVKKFFEDNYSPLQYYSKTSIDDGSIYPQLKNTSRGFTYFLKNTETYNIDGEEIKGGILTFKDKLEGIKTKTQETLDKNELFTPEELQEIKDVLQEYNSFLLAYYNVEELYELAQEIIRLFPKALAGDVDVSEIMLSEDKLTGDKSTYKVTYSEILDYDECGDYYAVRVSSKNGAMENDYGDSVTYNVAINSDSKASDAILEATPYEATVTNNTYTPANPWNVEIVPSISTKPTGLRGAVSDTLTVELVLVDKVEETVEGTTTTKTVETVIDEETIIVSYSMGDYYTVTIPAVVEVKWDDATEQDVSYSVTSEMSATSKITVGVTDKTTNFDTTNNTGKLVADANNYLTYTATNFVETTFVGTMANTEPTNKPQIKVDGWDNVPVGKYKTTLTYTVTYSDGTP